MAEWSHIIAVVIAIPIITILDILASLFPHKKEGFFCNDNEIRYPYQPYDTVPSNQMTMGYAFLSFILITISEVSLVRHICQRNSNKRLHRKTGAIHPVLLNIVHLLLTLFCSYRVCIIIVGVGKRTCSRLRPNFLDACRPNLTLLCKPGQIDYIEEYVCSREIEDDEYYSFPSGHSAIALNFSVFLIYYVQKRCKFPYVFRSMVQFPLSLIAFFICMSRVRDSKHRIQDVLSGGFIGFAIGIFFMKYVLYNFKPNRYELRELDGEFLEHHNRLDRVRVIQDGPTQQQLDMERHMLKPYSDYGSCTNSSLENIYDESSNNVKC